MMNISVTVTVTVLLSAITEETKNRITARAPPSLGHTRSITSHNATRAPYGRTQRHSRREHLR
jgi:hypothetical protein